jgi:GNAT superfamily N-acetyltransferase
MRHDGALVDRLEGHLRDLALDYLEAQVELLPGTGPCARRFAHLTAIADRLGHESCIVGFGERDAPGEAETREAVAWLEAQPRPAKDTLLFAPADGVRVILAPTACASHAEMLGTMGFRFWRSTTVVARPLDDGFAARTSDALFSEAPGDPISVIAVEDGALDEVLDVICRGFADGVAPNDRQRMVAASWGRTPGVVHFVARGNEGVLGGCALFLRGDVAYLTGMSVLPPHRGRGIQRRLIRARLAHAKAHGASLAFATCAPIGVSRRNLESAAFRTAYSRIALVKPPPPE